MKRHEHSIISSCIDWYDFEFRNESSSQLPLWEDFVRPKTIEDVKGQESAKSLLIEWIKNPTKAVLLAGPSGCGKTSLAKCLLKSKNYEIWDETWVESRAIEFVGTG
jgi:replication-associated recombination protein RarA